VDVGVIDGLASGFTTIHADVEGVGPVLLLKVWLQFAEQIEGTPVLLGIQIEDSGNVSLGDDEGMPPGHRISVENS
jgi:hypothetical protein